MFERKVTLPNGHIARSTTTDESEHARLHSYDGKPAVEYSSPDGKVYHQRWMNDGVLHRIQGPASVTLTPNGQECTYALNGRVLSERYVKLNDLLAEDGSFKDDIMFGLTMGGYDWLISEYPDVPYEG